MCPPIDEGFMFTSAFMLFRKSAPSVPPASSGSGTSPRETRWVHIADSGPGQTPVLAEAHTCVPGPGLAGTQPPPHRDTNSQPRQYTQQNIRVDAPLSSYTCHLKKNGHWHSATQALLPPPTQNVDTPLALYFRLYICTPVAGGTYRRVCT